MKPQRIYFLRHGESEGNVNGAIHETVPDHRVGLTERGRLQASDAGVAMRAVIGNEGIAIYRSPFLRTRQTLECFLVGFNAATGQIERVREDPRLREQEWGHMRSHGETQRIEKERAAYGSFYYRLPDGESGADVYDRCTGVLDTLYRDFEKPHFPPNVLIVSHGLTIRLLLMRWLHWGVEEFESKRNPRNCEVFQLARQGDGHYQLTEPFPEKEGWRS